MSLFDSASIVVTPNAYKASKLYAIKPTDGSGDLTVVRATSATRVDSNGLIEIPRTNLTQRSEDFSNGYWVKTNSDITSNSTIAPDNVLSADTFSDRVLTSQTYVLSRNQSYTSGTAYTSSFFAKNLNRRYVYMRFVSSVFGTNKYVFFDLQLGTIISADSGVTAEIIDYGNGWFRCIATSTASVTTTTTNGVFIGLSDNGVNVSYTNPSVKSIYIWGAQLQEGNVATEYIPTTSSIRTKFAGIIQDGSSASNIPRLDYTNSTCPSLLVEPQRTNLVLRSEEFNTTNWAKTNITVTANNTIAPDGNLTADLITATATNGYLYPTNTNIFASAGGTARAYSVFLKAGTATSVRLIIATASVSQNFSSTFNLSLGTATADTANTTVFIENYGNGWYRCTISATIASATYSELQLGRVANGLNFYAWGAQLEAGSNATSYIPTTTASVTRNADVISKTGISSLIGQTEGTIYMEVNVNNINNSAGRLLYTIYNNSTNARISSGIGTNNKIDLFVTGPPNTQIFSQTISTGKLKLAVSYKNSNIFLTVNGVLATAITTLNVPASMNSLTLGAVFNGTFQLGNGIDLFAHWKTALTDQECINLTTI